MHPVRTFGLLALVRFFGCWLDAVEPAGDGVPGGLIE
jgi:hypothetical protein